MFALVAGFVALLPSAAAIGVAPEVTTSYLTDMNLFGRDYRSFNIVIDGPERCQQACVDEARCKAWTYVKPGIQRTSGKCWLEDSVPGTADNCCTSGVKQIAASDAAVPGGAAIIFEPVRRSGVRRPSPTGCLEVHTSMTHGSTFATRT